MTAPLTPTELAALAEVAERSVHLAVCDGRTFVPDPTCYPPSLREPGAVFVTLRRDGRLMGCIGTLAPISPLVVAVADRARAAAFDDPRFPGIRPVDLLGLEVSVSVLSAPQPIAVQSYAELLHTVQPGVDGLIVDSGIHRATLLPSVWEEIDDPRAFVAVLWRKAGLEPGQWPVGIRLSRYTAQHAVAGHPART